MNKQIKQKDRCINSETQKIISPLETKRVYRFFIEHLEIPNASGLLNELDDFVESMKSCLDKKGYE